MKKRKTLTAKKELIKGRIREITLRELDEVWRPGMTWVEAAEEGYKILGEPPLTPDEKKEFEQIGKQLEQIGKQFEQFGKELEKGAEAGKDFVKKYEAKRDETKAEYKKVLRGEKARLKYEGKSLPSGYKVFYWWFITKGNPGLFNMPILDFLDAKIPTIQDYHLHFYSDDRGQVRATKAKERPNKKHEGNRFSVLEWATIFYYANETKLLFECNTIKSCMELFINKHNISTTFKSLKSKYYQARKRINEIEDFPIEKLKKIMPFLKENYQKTVVFVENDILILQEKDTGY